MSPQSIIVALTFVSMFLYIAIAIRGRKSQKSGIKAFFFKPNLSLFMISASLMATQIGGGVLLGTADAAMRYGWVSLLFNAGTSLGLISVGWVMAGFIRQTQAETAGALCESCYGSQLIRKIIGSLTILWMTGLLVAQLIALRKLLITIGISDAKIFLGLWVCLVAYTSIGGFKAVIRADVIQVCLMIILFVSLFFLNSAFTLNLGSGLVESGGSDISSGYLGRLCFAPFLSAFLDQEMIQRFASASTAKIARRAAYLAGTGIFIFAIIPASFGIASAREGLLVPLDNNALIAWLQHSHHPWGLILGSYAMIAAVVSTCDSLLCAIGSCMALDLLPRRKSAFDTSVISPLVIAFIGFVGFYFSYFSNNIFDVIVTSGGAFISVAFVPIVYTYTGKQYPASAGFSAIIIGFVIFVLFSYTEMGITRELSSIFGSYLTFNLFKYRASKAVT